MSEAAGTLNIFSEIAQANNFVVQQDSVQTDTVIQSDILKTQEDTVPPLPTFEQIRYWRWLREKKLLIDGSHYIQPKDKVKLVSSVKVESEILGLPVHEKNSFNSDWVTILFVLALILFASVRGAYSKYIGSLFQSLISYSTSFRLFREKNYSISHAAFRLDLIFYFTFSLFLYQIVRVFQLELINGNLSIFAVSFGVVTGYFILKKMAYYFVGWVFESGLETSEFLFNMDNFNRTVGIMLFPIVVLINYYPYKNTVFVVVAGILVVGVFYAFLLQRGIFILLRKQFSIFYLFLYLCTLEFLPLFLIYHVVVL